MTRMNWLMFCAAALGSTTIVAVPAAAQTRSEPRVEISANVGALTGASEFSASDSFASNGGETETISVDHAAKTVLGFNVGGAVRMATQFWMGVQYAVADMKPRASIAASIPHPILFNAPRTVEGSVNGVAHKEQNVHVDLMYALPVSGMDVKVMGGPTFFNLKQDFVSAVSINETYPFDTATFAAATTKRESGSAVGFNAGVDISRALSSQVGLGGLIRYSRADVKLGGPNKGQHTVTAGGIEAAGGVRVRF